MPFIFSKQNSNWIETELKILQNLWLLHRKLHFWVVMIEKKINKFLYNHLNWVLNETRLARESHQGIAYTARFSYIEVWVVAKLFQCFVRDVDWSTCSEIIPEWFYQIIWDFVRISSLKKRKKRDCNLQHYWRSKARQSPNPQTNTSIQNGRVTVLQKNIQQLKNSKYVPIFESEYIFYCT